MKVLNNFKTFTPRNFNKIGIIIAACNKFAIKIEPVCLQHDLSSNKSFQGSSQRSKTFKQETISNEWLHRPESVNDMVLTHLIFFYLILQQRGKEISVAITSSNNGAARKVSPPSPAPTSSNFPYLFVRFKSFYQCNVDKTCIYIIFK